MPHMKIATARNSLR